MRIGLGADDWCLVLRARLPIPRVNESGLGGYSIRGCRWILPSVFRESLRAQSEFVGREFRGRADGWITFMADSGHDRTGVWTHRGVIGMADASGPQYLTAV